MAIVWLIVPTLVPISQHTTVGSNVVNVSQTTAVPTWPLLFGTYGMAVVWLSVSTLAIIIETVSEETAISTQPFLFGKIFIWNATLGTCLFWDFRSLDSIYMICYMHYIIIHTV